MSVKIDPKTNKITMTRGDTLRVAVSMMKDSEEYTPVEGDVVRFAVKHPKMTSGNKEFVDTEPILLTEIPIDTMVLELEPEDTKQFPFGDYTYDIQITFVDGTVDTFITTATLTLTPEVE